MSKTTDRSDDRWLRPGGFIRVRDPTSGARGFFFVEDVFWGRFNYVWSQTVAPNTLDEQEIIEDLKPLAVDNLFQVILGIKGAAIIYLDLPTSERLGGTPKVPRATATNRRVGWWDHHISPYVDPSFDTEFFLQKGSNFEEPNFEAYNPTEARVKPELRFELNKCVIVPVEDADVVDKLQRKVIHYRPITLGPLPAERSGQG